MAEYTAGRARILLEPTARNFYTNARKAINENIGTRSLHADVRLRPIADGFHTEAEKKIAATADINKRVGLKPILDAQFRKSARDQVNLALQNLHLTARLSAEVDFTKANAQILAWRRRQEAVPLRIQVLPQQGGIGGVTQGAGSRNWRARHIPGANPAGGGSPNAGQMLTPQINARQLQQNLVNAVGTAVSKANASPAANNQLNVKGKVSLPGMSDPRMRRMVNDLQRDFQDNFRLRIQPSIAGVQLRLPLGSLGTQVIPAAVAAIGSLISSLQQLSQAGLALPGALSVAGASLGTLAVGLMGMGDAWKALTAEEDRSANSAQTDSARMVQAHNAVRNSTVDVTQAQKDLTDARKDARRNLEDLHNEERSNNLSVAEAMLNLRRARNELAKGGFKGPLDRDEAILRELRAREQVDNAVLRQKRNKEDVIEADKKGVSQADSVVSAQENLTRAIQAQTDAMTALKLESSAAANAADKTKAAMENLGPEAAKVVKAVWDQRGAFIELRKVASGNMFRNFDNEVNALANASLPLLTRRLGGMGTVWNETLTKMTGNLRSQGTQSIVDRIFGNTEETQRRLNQAIDPIIRGIGTLAAAGSDSMPRLANAIEVVSNNFANFITRADREGRLQQWIDTGLEAFATLGRVIGNVGGIINGVTKAFGGSFLTNIEQITARIERFMNSAQGQEDLRIFIANVKSDFEAWRPILEDLPMIFGTAMEAARQAIQLVLPILNVFTEVIGASPALIGAVVTAFLAWSTIKPIMNGVQVAAVGISTIITELGTGFLGSKAKAAEAAQGINLAFDAVGRGNSGPAKAASKIAAVGSAMAVGGPLFAGISVAIVALASLVDSHDDAAEAAARQETAIGRVADALDRVTQSAGAASRAQIAQEMQDFKPTDAAGLGGDVERAMGMLGMNPSNLVTAALPGGGTQRASLNNDFIDKVRPTISAALNERRGSNGVPLRETFAQLGLSEDDVINAFLGDQAALQKYRDAMAKGRSVSAGGTGMADQLAGFNLADVRTAVEAAGGQVAAAGLAGQYLNWKAPTIQSTQDRAQAAQRTASGKNPTLSPDGERYFAGKGVTSIGFDSTTNQFGLVAHDLTPSQIENLKARNNQVGAPYDDGQGTAYQIIFSEADAKTLLSYAAGGPSPDGKGRGPTGGHIVELHSDEWVLPAHARKRIGDPTLWALTGGDRKKRRSGFNIGGPGGLAMDLPPIIPPPVPGVGTGPLPGPPPTVPALPAPAATGFDTTIPTGPDAHGPLPVTSDPAAMGTPPAGEGMIPGQTPVANAGNNFLNAWFPWLPTVQSVMAGDQGAIENFGMGDPSIDPLAHVAEWGGNFLTNLGSTLMGGVLGFFGLDPSLYTNAMSQVVGFYGNKFGGGGTDQYVDEYTQGVFDQSTGAYTSYPGTTTLGDGTVISTGTGLSNTAVVGKPYEGSGVIAAGSPEAQAKIDASRAPNAQVIADANIVNYIREQAAKFGLTMGMEGQEGGDPYRKSENSSLHTVGMAGDIMGSPEDRRRFLEAWHADPLLKNATRMIIDDNNQDLEMYAGGAPSFNYDRGAHGDHIHLGLEGVPGFTDPANPGVIMQRNVGGGSTIVSGSNGTTASGQPTWGTRQPRTPRVGTLSGGGLSGGPSGSPSASSAGGGMPDLQFPGSPSTSSAGGGGGAAPAAPGSGGSGSITDILPGLKPGGGNMNPFGIPSAGGGGGSGAGINLALARQQALQRQQGGRQRPKAPAANYAGGNPQIWDAVYQAFLEAGFNPAEWGAAVNLLNGESGWKPTIANPSSGAFGLFQFLGATQKAYLPDKNPDPYIQGKAGMKYIKDRYGSPAEAWEFWQNQSPHWYDNSGILPRGASVVVNQKNEDEVIIGRRDAQKAKKRIEEARTMQPNRGGPVVPPGAIPPTTKTPGPPLTPDVDIPRALGPTPGISAPAADAAPRQTVGAAPSSHDYVLPAVAQGISSGAATLGSIAQMAASMGMMAGGGGAAAAGGGAGGAGMGAMVSGLFQQGGKIATGFANVVSAALTGITKSGTTENPYGVTLKNNRSAPPLAQDNRRVHNGDNNFASMDEWRRQTQIQDAQDMQAGMTRMKV